MEDRVAFCLIVGLSDVVGAGVWRVITMVKLLG